MAKSKTEDIEVALNGAGLCRLPLSIHKFAAGVLKHWPLPSVSIPGFHLTLSQGMRAVVTLIIVKISKMLALRASDQTIRTHSSILRQLHFQRKDLRFTG